MAGFRNPDGNKKFKYKIIGKDIIKVSILKVSNKLFYCLRYIFKTLNNYDFLLTPKVNLKLFGKKFFLFIKISLIIIIH